MIKNKEEVQTMQNQSQCLNSIKKMKKEGLEVVLRTDFKKK